MVVKNELLCPKLEKKRRNHKKYRT